jgi:hypothetical protein
MKTVEEILRESGLTDEQIKALDAKVVAGVTTVLSTASQTLDAAELAKRAQQEQYDKEIAPALDKWANDQTNLAAERDYWKTMAEKAKEGGFIPAATPFTPPTTATTTTTTTAGGRDTSGRFVAGANPVPGSPQYMTREDGFQAITAAQWTISEYMRLHNGAPPPDEMATLANEAAQAHMPYRQYVEKKYGFQEKRDKIKADAQKQHDDAIRKEVAEQKDKEWAEKVGSNPMTRMAETSRFTEVRAAIKEGTRPDPLKTNREQRRIATRNAIQKEIAENESSTVQ